MSTHSRFVQLLHRCIRSVSRLAPFPVATQAPDWKMALRRPIGPWIKVGRTQTIF